LSKGVSSSLDAQKTLIKATFHPGYVAVCLFFITQQEIGLFDDATRLNYKEMVFSAEETIAGDQGRIETPCALY
jgi:hypothetical protein